MEDFIIEKIPDYPSMLRMDVRRILENLVWAEQYTIAAEPNAGIFYQDPNKASYMAKVGNLIVGFIYVHFRQWNELAKIEGFGVAPSVQRQGVDSELVKRVEEFVRAKGARGIYVDTPTLNVKGRGFYEAVGYKFGYEMPRYYDDTLDGVTYQKFF